MPLVGKFETQEIEFHREGVKVQGTRIPFSFIAPGDMSLAGLPLFTFNPIFLMDLSLAEMGRIKSAILEMAARKIREDEIRRMDLFEKRMLLMGPPKTISMAQFTQLIPIVYEINVVCNGNSEKVKRVMDEWEKNATESKKDLYSTLLVILEEEFYVTGGFDKIGKVGGAGAIARVGVEKTKAPFGEAKTTVEQTKPPMEQAKAEAKQAKIVVPLEIEPAREWSGTPLLRAETPPAEIVEIKRLMANARKMTNTKVVSLREMLRFYFERYPAEYQDVLRTLFGLSDSQLADPVIVEAVVRAEVERLGAFRFSHRVYMALIEKWKKKNEKDKLEKFGCLYDPMTNQFIICSLCATLKGIASMLLSKLKGG